MFQGGVNSGQGDEVRRHVLQRPSLPAMVIASDVQMCWKNSSRAGSRDIRIDRPRGALKRQSIARESFTSACDRSPSRELMFGTLIRAEVVHVLEKRQVCQGPLVHSKSLSFERRQTAAVRNEHNQEYQAA